VKEKFELYYYSKYEVAFRAEATMEQIKNKKLSFSAIKNFPEELKKLDRWETLIILGEDRAVGNWELKIEDVALKMLRKQKLKAML
jgi:hypothetical protein